VALLLSPGASCTCWTGDVEDGIIVDDKSTPLAEKFVVAVHMAAPAIVCLVVSESKTSEGLC